MLTWRRAWRRVRGVVSGDARVTVTSDEGYRMWAGTYGDPPNRFQQLEEEALREMLPAVAGQRVLDLGCGKGRAGRLAIDRGAASAVGLDRSPAMLAAGPFARQASLTCVVGDAPHLPFASGAFDVVISALVLGHVADLAGALGEAARVLRAGGVLIVSDFHPFATLRGWQRTVVDPASRREYAITQHLHMLSDYVDQFQRLGLNIEALREPGYDGFPVVFVLRARKRLEPAR
jgi:malonyl-CoA O-methyltransferase